MRNRVTTRLSMGMVECCALPGSLVSLRLCCYSFVVRVVCSVGLEIVVVAKERFGCVKVGLKDRLNGIALSRHCLRRQSTEDEHKEGL